MLKSPIFSAGYFPQPTDATHAYLGPSGYTHNNMGDEAVYSVRTVISKTIV